MALIIPNSNPQALLNSIYKAIDNKSVATWIYEDHDGTRYLTHIPDQWKRKAWLKGVIYQGELRFGIIPPKNTKVTKEIYGVYHGRFIEMLLAHFDGSFDRVTATTQPTTPDSL